MRGSSDTLKHGQQDGELICSRCGVFRCCRPVSQVAGDQGVGMPGAEDALACRHQVLELGLRGSRVTRLAGPAGKIRPGRQGDGMLGAERVAGSSQASSSPVKAHQRLDRAVADRDAAADIMFPLHPGFVVH
jgi:hypothetical protein